MIDFLKGCAFADKQLLKPFKKAYKNIRQKSNLPYIMLIHLENTDLHKHFVAIFVCLLYVRIFNVLID